MEWSGLWGGDSLASDYQAGMTVERAAVRESTDALTATPLTASLCCLFRWLGGFIADQLPFVSASFRLDDLYQTVPPKVPMCYSLWQTRKHSVCQKMHSYAGE